MKKIIFASLTVLSLGLFSFAPAPTVGSIIKTQCGDYIVDNAATCQKVMSAADYQQAGALIGRIYNIPPGSGQTKVDMIPTADAMGGSVSEWWVAELVCLYRQTKWDNCTAITNPDAQQYIAILDKYSSFQ